MRSLQLFPWRTEPSASLWEEGVPLQYWCWQPSQSLEAAHHFGSLRYDRLVVQGQPLRDFIQSLLTAEIAGSFRGFLRFVRQGEPLEWSQWSGLQREENLFLPRAWWEDARGWEAHLRMAGALWGEDLSSQAGALNASLHLTPVPDESSVRAWADKMGVAYAEYSPGEKLSGRGLIWRRGERAQVFEGEKQEWELLDYQQLWAPRDLWPYFWQRDFRWAVVGNLLLHSPRPKGMQP